MTLDLKRSGTDIPIVATDVVSGFSRRALIGYKCGNATTHGIEHGEKKMKSPNQVSRLRAVGMIKLVVFL